MGALRLQRDSKTAGALYNSRTPETKRIVWLWGVADFQQARQQWVSGALSRKIGGRNERWSAAIAVGEFTFVHKVKSELGFKAMHRRVLEDTGTYTLREESEPYSASFTAESEALRPENTLLWDENADHLDIA